MDQNQPLARLFLDLAAIVIPALLVLVIADWEGSRPLKWISPFKCYNRIG